jgi:hypothetical protein
MCYIGHEGTYTPLACCRGRAAAGGVVNAADDFVLESDVLDGHHEGKGGDQGIGVAEGGVRSLTTEDTPC